MNDDKGKDLDQTLQDLGIGTDVGGVPPEAEEDLGFDVPLPGQGVLSDEGDARDRAESFLVNLLLNIDPAYAVEVYDVGEGEVSAEIYGGDAGRLIGKNGRTLGALEQLANAVVNKVEDDPVRVNIDVGGYKRRRDERLRGTARKAADQVRTRGEAVELEPMTAAERRIVHMAVADDPDIVSESTGEGRDRRVVLLPRPL